MAKVIYNGQQLLVGSQGAPGVGMPCGAIVEWPMITIPAGWLLCDGTTKSRTIYADLFAVIGTTYGAGDGSTTFGIPDFRGRVPVGYDITQTEFNTLGKTGGEKTHTQTVAEMPVHGHTLRGGPSGLGFGVTTAGTDDNTRYGFADSVQATNGSEFSATNTGSGTAFNVLQPYSTINYIICYRKEGQPILTNTTVTNLTGILKGTGATVAAATVGSDYMNQYRTISANANNMLTGGIGYLCDASTLNRPSSIGDFGTILSLGSDSTFIGQVALDRYGAMFTRGYASWEGTWKSWRTVWDNGNRGDPSCVEAFPNGPATFVSTTPSLITYSSANVNGSVITFNTTNSTFSVTRSCCVIILYQCDFNHSATGDTWHVELYQDGALQGIIGSCEVAPNIGGNAIVNTVIGPLVVGAAYSLKIRANGGSGTHTMVSLTYQKPKLSLIAVQ